MLIFPQSEQSSTTSIDFQLYFTRCSPTFIIYIGKAVGVKAHLKEKKAKGKIRMYICKPFVGFMYHWNVFMMSHILNYPSICIRELGMQK